jgi:hypothetical protein
MPKPYKQVVSYWESSIWPHFPSTIEWLRLERNTNNAKNKLFGMKAHHKTDIRLMALEDDDLKPLFAVFRLVSGLLDDMQGKLKWNLLVWPRSIKHRYRRAECFKIQKM